MTFSCEIFFCFFQIGTDLNEKRFDLKSKVNVLTPITENGILSTRENTLASSDCRIPVLMDFHQPITTDATVNSANDQKSSVNGVANERKKGKYVDIDSDGT